MQTGVIVIVYLLHLLVAQTLKVVFPVTLFHHLQKPQIPKATA